MAFATLAAEVRWWGGSPGWLHATNVAIHAVTTLGLFAVLRNLVSAPSRNGAAALGACAFALFPRRVEAVAWLSCRPDLLCALFGVGMLWLALGSGTRNGRARRLWAHVAWWCALLSKEAALALPLALPFLEPAREGGAPLRSRLVGLWPWFVSGAAFLGVRRAVLGAWLGGYGPEVLTLTPSAAAAPAKFLAYLVVPPVEWLSSELMQTGLRVVVAAVILVGLAALGVLLVSRRHEAAVRGGAAWVAAAALPVVLLNVSLTTTFNDRLFYLPGLGVGMMLAGLAASLSRRSVAVLWLLVLGYGAQQQTVAARWAVAGRVTEQVLAGIAEAAARRGPPERLLVAALPDSYRGAYLLRNGLEQALALRDVVDAGRVVPLGLYYLDDQDRMPVEAWRVSAREVCVQSSGSRDEVVVRFPPAGGPLAVATTTTRDRYGRRPYVLFRMASPAEVIAVSPLGEVAPVLQAHEASSARGTVDRDDRAGGPGRVVRCPAWEDAPVRQPEPR
jgi:hypothetical protein